MNLSLILENEKRFIEYKEKYAQSLTNYKQELEFINNRLNISLKAADMGIYDYKIPLESDGFWSESWAAILGYKLGELPADKRNMNFR